MTERTAMQTRILSRVAIEDRGFETPCWVSNRAAHSAGYTKIGIGGKTHLTHRVAYEEWVGLIPDGLHIDHLCRVRACCNPSHLEPVTCRENLLRGETITAAEAAQTHCKAGHPLSGDNVYHRPDRPRGRDCITCRNEAKRRSYRRTYVRKADRST